MPPPTVLPRCDFCRPRRATWSPRILSRSALYGRGYRDPQERSERRRGSIIWPESTHSQPKDCTFSANSTDPRTRASQLLSLRLISSANPRSSLHGELQ
ncbi:hypothetical protein PFISCL1PPCAC_21219 [Pristionchus fissidentatus]|uniref:Uncharacterized protein n=1 Tax=Pristionchus fissidentatus TaxID=1538716 RepID=A0AAV5WJ62_9BILA|nr:hypothetical protein PFISCL1PPCAC_21219 [Pristionchus fissidentatus]